ncbi:hypothetical protein BH10BAC1_BH10BAC1_06880 [soil metagenome]
MKKLYTLFIAILFTGNSFAQGQIMSFIVSPASPTTTDFVKVYVTVQFGSGGCTVSNQGSGTTGSVSTGYALHCLGMLSMICATVDSFNLGYLPAGPHVFNFTLSSGFGGPPCSPGFAPDDIDSVNFVVAGPTGISSIANNKLVSISPNPMHSSAIFKIDASIKLKNATLKIVDVTGRTVKIIEGIEINEIEINRNEINNGIYFYSLIEAEQVISKGKLVIE